ncbi:DUF6348 family protein [Utexia brackfieldae]|uniref:DUF6348 family protein n=1 Tax=Utexia brackfieldae TaxID=3074108 RepID=UPI00370DCAFC
MGLLSRFKHPKMADHQEAKTLFLQALKDRLVAMQYHVVMDKHHIIIESQLTIVVEMIDDSQTYLNALHLCMRLKNHYLPGDIEEHIIGWGNTIQKQVNTALDYFISVVFLPIQGAFSESHQSDLDFIAMIDERKILFHPKLGKLFLSGEWPVSPATDHFFNLINTSIRTQLIDRKFNWLKICFTHAGQGIVQVQCDLNNQAWPAGQQILQHYVQQLPKPQVVTAASQMIIFRLCDAYEQLI